MTFELDEQKSRSTIEMHDLSYRAAIAGGAPNMADYDVVYVGFPIWWYIAPTIINTFLESCDFTGKAVVVRQARKQLFQISSWYDKLKQGDCNGKEILCDAE